MNVQTAFTPRSARFPSGLFRRRNDIWLAVALGGLVALLMLALPITSVIGFLSLNCRTKEVTL